MSSKIIHGFLQAGIVVGQQANLRMIGGSNRQVGIPGLADGPLHVGLSGADPHFADEHVTNADFIATAYRHRERAAGREGTRDTQVFEQGGFAPDRKGYRLCDA